MRNSGVAAGIVIWVVSFVSHFSIPSVVSYFSIPSTKIDAGGVASLVFTIGGFVFAWGYGVFEGSTVSHAIGNKGSRVFFFVPLWGVFFVSTWTTVRVIGLFVNKLLFQPNFVYAQLNIFNLIGWALLSFLAYSLIRALGDDEQNPIRAILQAALTAVAITIIVTVPALGDFSATGIVNKSAFPVVETILLTEGILIGILILALSRIKDVPPRKIDG